MGIHFPLRVAAAACMVAVLLAVGFVVDRAREKQAAAVAQRAEAERIRKALIQAAEAAERALIATTPPKVRQAHKDAALREFQAAEAEMLMQQTRARRAREARGGGAVADEKEGRGASAPRP
ncbi:MAG: hypothetical protein Q7T97_04985 [Burkholderiaceae bacterium]|nr:hypothetical protein [Burkholderiaceae bacterium]